MKDSIHPKTNDITITCTCGATFQTGSTLKDNYTVELCSRCHPFFTGKQRLVDSTGRVERFQKRFEKFQAKQKAAADKAAPESQEQ